jgi:hypothetical protein
MDMGIIAAEKTQCVIIAAAQLGREDRKESTKGDDTQGWRESGDIEQTAWNLIKMMRKKENNKDSLSFRIVKARSSEGVDTAYSLEWIPGYQYMEYNGKSPPPEKSKGKKTEAEKKGTGLDFDWKKLMGPSNDK